MSQLHSYRLLAAAAFAGTIALSSSAAMAGSATGHASATILPAITVTENTQINFGKVAVDSSAQCVVISAAGAVTCPSQYTCTGSPTAGAFTATGQASTAVTLSFSTGDTLTGPGTAMGLGSFTNNAGGSPSIGAGGTLAFAVGASLAVGANQTPGSYTGTYTVTVNY
jgi:hypothetical protein